MDIDESKWIRMTKYWEFKKFTASYVVEDSCWVHTWDLCSPLGTPYILLYKPPWAWGQSRINFMATFKVLIPESRTQGKMFDGIFAHQRIWKRTLRWCQATFNQTAPVINPIDTKDTPMVKKRMPSVSTNQHSVIFPGMYVMKGVNARPASGAEKGTRAAHYSAVCLLIAFHKWTKVDEPRTRNTSHFVNVYTNFLYELQ